MTDRPVVHQRNLLDLLEDAPAIDRTLDGLVRRDLGSGAWVDHLPGWLHGSDVVFDALLDVLPWKGRTVTMYDRRVEQPRLTASFDIEDSPLPILTEISEVLTDRYGLPLVHCHLNLYRDGQDGVAWHGDRVARDRMDTATVGIVSVGEPRPFLLRPYGGGRSIRYELGGGDLLVMGGTCQRTWQHTVPKVRQAGPRISITLRHWIPA